MKGEMTYQEFGMLIMAVSGDMIPGVGKRRRMVREGELMVGNEQN